MTAGEISFAGLDLNDGTSYRIRGTLVMPNSGPELMSKSLAYREGDIVVDRRYPSKKIPLSGSIHGGSPAVLESRLDTLVKTLNSGRQIFKPGWQDERYYLAEQANTLRIVRAPINRFLVYETELWLPDPFAYAATASTLSDTSALTQVLGNHRSKSFSVTPGGTIYAHPGITLTITALGTATSAIWIICADLPGTPTLTITRAFALNDVIIIDPVEQSVKVNGVEVDYTGTFPILDPTVGTTNGIEIHSTSTANPTIAAAIDWLARYEAA